MIRGKKNGLQIVELELAFGFLFRLADESVSKRKELEVSGDVCTDTGAYTHGRTHTHTHTRNTLTHTLSLSHKHTNKHRSAKNTNTHTRTQGTHSHTYTHMHTFQAPVSDVDAFDPITIVLRKRIDLKTRAACACVCVRARVCARKRVIAALVFVSWLRLCIVSAYQSVCYRACARV